MEVSAGKFYLVMMIHKMTIMMIKKCVLVSSTWCTSFVSSWVAFSASFVKKSELAFGEGEDLKMVEVRK